MPQVGPGEIGAGQIHLAHVLVAQVGAAKIGVGTFAFWLDDTAIDGGRLVVSVQRRAEDHCDGQQIAGYVHGGSHVR